MARLRAAARLRPKAELNSRLQDLDLLPGQFQPARLASCVSRTATMKPWAQISERNDTPDTESHSFRGKRDLIGTVVAQPCPIALRIARRLVARVIGCVCVERLASPTSHLSM